jgi:hypothetical protein
MRIAQVFALFEAVTPAASGGLPQTVFHLTEELMLQGHAVTLFASGDSRTEAELVAPWPRALARDPDSGDPALAHAILLDLVAGEARRFDLIHFHLGGLHLPLLRFLSAAHLTTLQGRLDRPATVALWSRFRHVPVVSTSDEQRAALPAASWQGTVRPGRSDEEGSGGPRLAREYLAIYERLLRRPAPYELGPVDIAMTPMPAIGGSREPFLRWDTPILEPSPPRSGDGET